MSTKVEIVPHGDRAIRITRAFQAPREHVFDAMSRPEMLKHWFHGPAGWTLTTCEMELRVGSSYRWAWTNDKGHEMRMGGTVLAVDRPSLLKTTEKFDDAWYEGEATNTLQLTEKDGVTLMTLIVEYESTDARDGVLAGPMASGMDASYDRLDAFLAQQHGAMAGSHLDPAVTALLDAHQHPLRAEIDALRSIILGVDPSISEGAKWNTASFRTTDWFATLNGHKHVKEPMVILHAGAKAKGVVLKDRIPDPEGLIKWLGNDRAQIAFRNASDITLNKNALSAIISAWIKLIRP